MPKKNVFAPFFKSKKSPRPLIFSEKKSSPPLFSQKKKSSPSYFSQEKSLRPLPFFEKKSSPPCRWSRPGYPINFDPSLYNKNNIKPKGFQSYWSKLTTCIGRVLGEICMKKIFAPLFDFSKSLT